MTLISKSIVPLDVVLAWACQHCVELRRQLIRRLVASIILALCLIVTPLFASDEKPNVILIVADDLGYGDISANGSKIATPNIDALAKNGVSFDQSYASANVCTPSRAGLMTGRYPIRTGLAYGVISSNDQRGLPKEEVTLAEKLQDAGYATALIGKWHLGHSPEYWPTRHGFDTFFGLPYSNDQTPLALYRAEQRISDEVDQKLLTQQYTEEATKIISNADGKPFFIFLSHTFPHIPLHVPSQFFGKSEAGLYGDVVEHLDWSVGRLVDELRRRGSLDNTLIIVTSDNGPWFEGSSGELRGGKGNSWEGAYRVPFVVSWPQKIAPAKTKAMTMNIDVFPTVLDAVGIDTPEALGLDGKSLLPLLTGRSKRSPHDYLFFFNNEELVGVRNARWKLLTRSYYRKDYAALDKFYNNGYWLLWDLQDSNPERYSMASRQPRVLEELRSVLERVEPEFNRLRTRAPMKVRY